MKNSLVKLTFGLSVVVLLNGCVAVALAPAIMGGASLVGGTMENGFKVTVNESTVTPEVREAFASASSIAVVAGDRSSVIAGDVLENSGGYMVTIDRVAAANGEMTGSERREALRKLCATTKPDIAILGRTVKTESSGIGRAMISGRVIISQEWITDVLSCRNGVQHSFGGTMEQDQGMYNPKTKNELEEKAGAEIGKKILEAMGVSKEEKLKQRAAAATSQAAANPAAQQPVGTTDRGSSSLDSTRAVQQKLVDIGYLSGKADGVAGKQTSDALRKFQKDNNLPPTGNMDPETLKRLATATRK